MSARCTDRDAFTRYVPTSKAPWNLERALRLHRRAGFGATYGELLRDGHDGPDAAITRVLDGDVRDAPRDFEVLSQRIVRGAVSSGLPDRLKAAWVHRMLHSPDPLRERMTLFWHDHFATSDSKLSSLGLMWTQNEIFRSHALAKFETLLRAVLQDPALPLWLDAIGSSAERPNQNLARELLELFTLGVGNFGESDVLEAARALTGLRIEDGRVRQDWAFHDDGQKTILGRTERFDLDSLITLLMSHPATARRITQKVLAQFLGPGLVSELAVEALTKEFAARDLDVGWLVETILRSEVLFSDESRQRKVLDPAGFVIGAVRALEIREPPVDTSILAQWMTQMGLDLYFPPSVGGWEGGSSWLDPRAMVTRGRFAEAISAGRIQGTSASRRVMDLEGLAARNGISPQSIAVADFMARVTLGMAWEDLGPELREEITGALRGVERTQVAGALCARVLASPEAQVC